MNYRFPKSLRLRKSYEFRRLGRSTSSYLKGDFLSVNIRVNRNGQTRLGITASRRYGKAHERNRFKRLVRESFRLYKDDLPVGFDLNVRPRYAAKEANMNHIRKELLTLVTNWKS